MSAKKFLKKIRQNPKDCIIEQLESFAKHYGIVVRKSSGSHVTFSHPDWIEILTVPAHRPIKPIYIKKFINLIDLLENGK